MENTLKSVFKFFIGCTNQPTAEPDVSRKRETVLATADRSCVKCERALNRARIEVATERLKIARDYAAASADGLDAFLWYTGAIVEQDHAVNLLLAFENLDGGLSDFWHLQGHRLGSEIHTLDRDTVAQKIRVLVAQYATQVYGAPAQNRERANLVRILLDTMLFMVRECPYHADFRV
jgi:hypothetical protein